MAVPIDINYHSFIRRSGYLIPRMFVSLARTFPYGVAFLLLAVMQLCCVPARALDGNYRIVITKSTRELAVMQGERVIKKYTVSYGKGHGPTKRRIGDNNTPTGRYRIVKFKPDSKFSFFMQLDYPNLLDAWYGYKDNIISSTDFRAIAAAFKNHQAPPQDTRLGGYIGIHGLGEVSADALKIHQTNNWTDGCIALKNEEINDLRRYVSIGTPIIIRP